MEDVYYVSGWLTARNVVVGNKKIDFFAFPVEPLSEALRGRVKPEEACKMLGAEYAETRDEHIHCEFDPKDTYYVMTLSEILNNTEIGGAVREKLRRSGVDVEFNLNTKPSIVIKPYYV